MSLGLGNRINNRVRDRVEIGDRVKSGLGIMH